LLPLVGGGFAGDHLAIGEDDFAADQFRRVDRFEAFYRVGFAVTSLRGFVLENKEVQERVGSSFCCQARYMRVPGSLACTYATNSLIAFLTFSTADAFTW
jgi:hypothetical protein